MPGTCRAKRPPYAHTWSIIKAGYAALERREIPETTPDWVNVDHRRSARIDAGSVNEFLSTAFNLTPELTTHVEAVHRLSDTGAVLTHVSQGTSNDGFEAEWRVVILLLVDGDLVNRCEVFDESDLDSALARFDELDRSAPRLQNAATQVFDRFSACFKARDWAAFAATLADDVSAVDHRRVVGAGTRHGRELNIADWQAVAELGTRNITQMVIATRGERLALGRFVFSGNDQRPEAFRTDTLGIIEIAADNRIATTVLFDLDDTDAAFADLDARFMQGEAAAHAQTWSVQMGAVAALNRHEIPATTPDWVNIDRRRTANIDAGDMEAYLRSSLEVTARLTGYIEAVHRLSDVAAVVTHVMRGTSTEGFDAEWRIITLITVDADLINRCEVFDESDVDAALARFDELSRRVSRLENAASRVDDRSFAYFGARNWTAMADILAEDSYVDDRRRVVNVGSWNGRDVVIENMRALIDGVASHRTVTVIATRGERLALTHVSSWNRDPKHGDFGVEVLNVVEIDTGERITAHVWFDLTDIDAAFAELDAHYLAAEAAPHAHTWSLVEELYSAFNRRKLPATAPDIVRVDHRQVVKIDAPDVVEFMRAVWDLTPEMRIHIEAVHRLSDLGSVVTHAAHGITPEGFDAEWRMVFIYTVGGDQINRWEIFDEADIDAALARFHKLELDQRQLENSASRVVARVWECFAARDWTAVSELMADDFSSHDHRRVVNAGVRHGRDLHIANMRAVVEVGFERVDSTVIATRGQRLALCRTRTAVRGLPPDEVGAEAILVIEIDAENRLLHNAPYDVDDIDAAFEELDARYLAGEAAAHSREWSTIAGSYAAISRHELPAATPDWVSVDRRRLVTSAIEPGDLTAYIDAGWKLTPQFRIYIEAVHRLSERGAVVTHKASGTSQDGFDAEWRTIDVLTLDGDLLDRCELFDDSDLEAALARFDELSRPVPALENASTRLWGRLADAFNRHDVKGFLALSDPNGRLDDRRKLLRAFHEGAEREMAAHALVGAPESWTLGMEVEPLAVRGERISLVRMIFRDINDIDRPIINELLAVMEVADTNLAGDFVNFDTDDIDAAFEELDARFIAGEAGAHARIWSLTVQTYAGFNRHELSPRTADWVNIDHRRLIASEPGEMIPLVRAFWDVTPDVKTRIEMAHRLSDAGVVFSVSMYGSSQHGFEAEWREIHLLMFQGHLINRCELFDEADLDAALARFDELSAPTTHLDNAATRARARVADAFNRRDFDGFLALHDGRYEDRREGLRSQGPTDAKFARRVAVRGTRQLASGQRIDRHQGSPFRIDARHVCRHRRAEPTDSSRAPGGHRTERRRIDLPRSEFRSRRHQRRDGGTHRALDRFR